MKLVDDRTPEQRQSHRWLVVGTDSLKAQPLAVVKAGQFRAMVNLITKTTVIERSERMPMDFPDMASLLSVAKATGFRQSEKGEAEHDYRRSLVEHVTPLDVVMAHEIKTGKGWDKWSTAERKDLLKQGGFDL